MKRAEIMPNTRQWHLILCAVIGAECAVLALLPTPRSAHPLDANSDRKRPAARRATDVLAEETSQHSALLATLSAEKRALEAEIRQLLATADVGEDAVRVSADFVSKRRFGRADSPISGNSDTPRLLRITEEEADAIASARSKALARAKAIEVSLVRRVPATEGKAVFMVDPWPEQAEPTMRQLEAELSVALGEVRGAIIFQELLNSTFVEGGKTQLVIAGDWRRSPDDPFFLPGGDPVPQIVINGSAPIPLDAANSHAVIERFGHVLGVESQEDLHRLFARPPEPEP